MITTVALAAILAGVWLAEVYREHDSQAMLLPDQVITLFPDPKPLTAFALTDDKNRVFDLASLKGKWSFLFFGFTHCPDVCPTTLVEMAQVVKELGTDGSRVQVLFVTVDPERDTQQVLKRYVPSFNPAFLGLYGDAEATARAAKEFKVYIQKQPAKDGHYSVDHSAGTYVLDREGRLRLFAGYGAGAPALLHDIRILLGKS